MEALQETVRRRVLRWFERHGRLEDHVVFSALDALRRGETTLEEIAVEPLSFDADLPVSEAIDRFQEEDQEMAFVLDGDRVVGLLTSTGALEAIAGELRDPFD